MNRSTVNLVSAVDPAVQDALKDLDRRMAAFYNSNALTQYYAHAEAANVTWSEDCGQALIKDRLRRNDYFGVIRHLWLRQVHYPSLLRRNFPPQRWPFLINVSPSCLYGDYYPDNDAVYFTYAPEITTFLASLGASDVTDHYMNIHRISRRQETVVLVAQKRLEQ